MNERKRHMSYRKKRFKHADIGDVTKIFSEEEYGYLIKYGAWMNALYHKKIKPISKQQKVFLKKMEAKKPPHADDLEHHFLFSIFWRYIKRLEIAKNRRLNNVRKTIKDDRADWKKMRKWRY